MSPEPPDVFIRIDDRLIHGQVVEGWLPFLKPDAVVVVSDAAAGDPIQQTLMSLNMPETVDLRFAATAAAPGVILDLVGAGRKVFVLTPGPREALALVEGGVPAGKVNVGGLHHSAGKIQVGKAIFLSEDDKGALDALSRLGVTLEGRAVPSEAPSNVLQLLET